MSQEPQPPACPSSPRVVSDGEAARDPQPEGSLPGSVVMSLLPRASGLLPLLWGERRETSGLERAKGIPGPEAWCLELSELRHALGTQSHGAAQQGPGVTLCVTHWFPTAFQTDPKSILAAAQ